MKGEKGIVISELFADVYFNYTSLNDRLKRKYPAAFEDFTEFEFTDGAYPSRYFEFFRFYQLSFAYRQTNVLKRSYAGTFSYNIYINGYTAEKLKRQDLNFRYYGINTKEKAIEKLIEKSFEIINYILKGWKMPEQVRRR